MRQLRSFVRKEFLHVLRDRKTLLILFGMPVVQILIFGFALSNEVKNTRIAIIDQANDAFSQQLTQRIDASRYFDVTSVLDRAPWADGLLRHADNRVVLIIPANIESELHHGRTAQLQAIVDASDPNRSSTVTAYLSQAVATAQLDLLAGAQQPARIDVTTRFVYNPQLHGAPNFVPGVMSLVLMLVCVMMTSIAIVREKELGTMEVLLVSPMNPFMVIISKVIPYFLLSLVNIASILLLSVVVLDLPIVGSVPLLYGLSMLFIITCLALGMLVSTIAATQAAAMLVSLMGMLLPTLLFSGFMFPIENMPLPMQLFSNLVPARWYYEIVKGVMIKGLGFDGVIKETLILLLMTTVFTAISVRRFKERLG
ncbi:MAG: ABC transporter permease [Candidatus Kapabacteria bacterium]|nr:ABC transporter permease [Candidatus Kapabacteria bacterium]